MAKKAKITSEMIAQAMGLVDAKTIVITCGTDENTVKIPIKTHLSIAERAMMVSDISNMVFAADGNADRYCPAFKKFATDFNIVSYFTDVVLPSDADKACRFLEQSELADKITLALPDGYISKIICEAYEAIEYRKQEALKRSKIDSLLDGVLDVIQSLREKTESADFSQILQYVENNMPELKGQLEQLISTQAAPATGTA